MSLYLFKVCTLFYTHLLGNVLMQSKYSFYDKSTERIYDILVHDLHVN